MNEPKHDLERRQMKAVDWIKVLTGPIVSVILFVVLYAIVAPSTSAQELINKHETRLGVVESSIGNMKEALKDVRDKVDKILDILIRRP